MKRVLVMTNSFSKELDFIGDYLNGAKYTLETVGDSSIYNTADTHVVVLKPYSSLICHRYHEIYIDSNLLFEKEYADAIENCLVQDGTGVIKGF